MRAELRDFALWIFAELYELVKTLQIPNKTVEVSCSSKLLYNKSLCRQRLYHLHFDWSQIKEERWKLCFHLGDLFAFGFNKFIFHLLTVCFGFKPAHCLPVTMWMKRLQKQQDRPFGFLCIGGRLNALSIFLYSPARFDSPLFLLLCISKEDPAEGWLLKYKWRRGTRCVTHFLQPCISRMPF